MNRFQQTLACTVLVLAAGMVSFVSAADERSARSAQWAEVAARQDSGSPTPAKGGASALGV